MNPQTRKYYIIIVHHGPPAITQRALDALAKSTALPEKVIVVDQAARPLTATGSNLHLLRPGRNSGYAAGLNTGLRALASLSARPTDIVLMMNNDVLLAPRALSTLKKWWQHNPGDCLASGISTENNQTINTLSHVNLITGRARIGSPPNLFSLPYIHGAFFAAPLKIFLQTKGLPEQYFLYWEDIAFSQMLSRQNIPLKIVPGVLARHQTAPATNGDKLYYLVRNGAYFLSHEAPFLWTYYWRSLNRLRARYHRWSGQPVVAQALADARRGRLGPRRLVL